MNVLLALTFVYGVLRLLTFTKLFDARLVGILESVFPENNSRKTLFRGFVKWIDILFLYFSLVFQAWYWLFR